MPVVPAPPSLRNALSLSPKRAALGLCLAAGLGLAMLGGARLVAQIEGDRGIAPLATSTDITVNGIAVNATGKTAEEARAAGWKQAIRKAWVQIDGPALPDGQLESLVSAVVVESELIGPKRYVARLGVIFDRTRAGQYVGAGEGEAGPHSAPMLVLPILDSGGVAQVFEVRGAWQKTWAEYNSSASPIDYVRVNGAGADSLLLTAGQAGRRSRLWWRTVLDQYGAADVLVPVARLERQWPGGPVRGTFTARYGPDNTYLGSFILTARNEAGVPAMLNRALLRLDQLYAGALVQGVLQPDPTLVAEQQALDAALAALQSALQSGETPAERTDAAPAAAPTAAPTVAAVVSSFIVQFASPDAAAVDAALGAVRSIAGVQGAATSSIAIGGTSVMRVSTTTDLDTLAKALRARGWRVQVGANALSIRR